MKLSRGETQRFYSILHGWADTAEAQKMHRYTQHGNVSTFDHCMSVAKTSFWLNRRLHLNADEESLVRGAFLHDFYLYDWHHCAGITRWHGFTHPGIALLNASALFPLNEREKNIIGSHMWPLTLRHLPRCREAAVVCLADKLCSAHETVLQRRAARAQ